MTNYSIKSLSERWDCDHKTVRRMIESGLLETFRIGTGEHRQAVRIKGESVERIERGGGSSDGDPPTTEAVRFEMPSQRWV